MGGCDRIDVEQQRHVSVMALELLIDIKYSLCGGRLNRRNATDFAVVSGTDPASATVGDENLDSVAVMGEFLRGMLV